MTQPSEVTVTSSLRRDYRGHPGPVTDSIYPVLYRGHGSRVNGGRRRYRRRSYLVDSPTRTRIGVRSRRYTDRSTAREEARAREEAQATVYLVDSG
jgi:hypothetical protein